MVEFRMPIRCGWLRKAVTGLGAPKERRWLWRFACLGFPWCGCWRGPSSSSVGDEVCNQEKLAGTACEQEVSGHVSLRRSLSSSQLEKGVAIIWGR